MLFFRFQWFITGTEFYMGWNVISIDLVREIVWEVMTGEVLTSRTTGSTTKTKWENVVVVSFGASLNTTMRGILLSECDIDYLIDVEGISAERSYFAAPWSKNWANQKIIGNIEPVSLSFPILTLTTDYKVKSIKIFPMTFICSSEHPKCWGIF